MPITITLAHGTQGLPLHPPPDLKVALIESPGASPLPDPAAALNRALDAPIDSPPLAALAQGRRRVCILVPDRTRACPLPVLLPPLLARLHRAHPAPGEIEILIATGLHRPLSPTECQTLVGEVAATAPLIHVVSHDARDPHACDAAAPGAPEPVRLNRRWLQADLRIIVSLVEPHLLAGYSGGAKMLLPGIADAASIHHAHRPAIVGHPRARGGMLRGNPLIALTHRAAALAPPHFHLATTVDAAGRLAGVWGGELLAAHRAAIGAAAASSEVRVAAPFDAAVTSGGGHPLDRTLYQSIKGLCAAARIVRPGGPLWLLSPCSEGIGSAEFTALLSRIDGPAAFFDLIAQPDFRAIDQWMAQHLCEVARDHPVLIQSPTIDPAWLRGRGLWPVAAEEEGWALLRRLAPGPAARVAVLPRGHHTLATLANEPADCDF